MKVLLTSILLCFSLSVPGQDLATGIQLFNSQQFDKAVKTLELISSEDAGYADARYYLGRIAYEQEDYEAAKGFFTAATKANDTSSEYFTWLGHALGTLTNSVGKLRQATLAPKIKNAYIRAVELDPDNLEAQWGLVRFYREAPGFVGGSLEKAEQSAKEILRIDPLDGHIALSDVYLRQEQPEKAEAQYIAAAAIDQRRLAHLGIFYQNQGWFDKAFDTFQNAFTLMPEDMNLLYQIGRTSALSGERADLGIESLERYLRETDEANASPSHAGAHMRLAMIYEKQGDFTKAKTFYQKALKGDPDMKLAKDGLKRVRKQG